MAVGIVGADGLVTCPKAPADCVVILTITEEGYISGWQRPGHEQGIRFKSGVSFVFLTQDAIDCMIPPHSECCRDHDADEREDEDES
jgi:hypothetical protein